MPNKIKVLHLIKSLGRGGAEKLIPETALVHDQTRFDFHCLYFYHQKNNIVDELQAAGIKVHLIPSGNLGLFLQIQKVRNFVLENKIAIIHAHLPWAGILSRLVGKGLEIPIVYTEHNTWDRYNKVSYLGNRFTFKNQDIAIAVSNEVALSMKLNSIFDPYRRGRRLKIKVIQNGVNTEVFKRISWPSGKPFETENDGSILSTEKENVRSENVEIGENRITYQSPVSNSEFQISNFKSLNNPNYTSDLKSRLNIPQASPVIGKVAVFRSQKRLWIWVDLALKILAACPETHFILVGDGEWRVRILDQIQKSGKQANFHWVGVQKEVIPYLSIMDIYLSTSEFEGLPIAMLEAMSCEVPVVATRAGGIGEVIQHGVQGFLSGIDEFEDLTKYCIQLIKDQKMHRQMALAARQRVVDRFSMSRMVKELEEVYESVISSAQIQN